MKLLKSYQYCNIYVVNTLDDTKIIPRLLFSEMDITDFMNFFNQELKILNQTNWFYYDLNNKRNYDLATIINKFISIKDSLKSPKLNIITSLSNLKNIINNLSVQNNYSHLRLFNNYLITMYRQINKFLYLQPEYHSYEFNNLVTNK